MVIELSEVHIREISKSNERVARVRFEIATTAKALYFSQRIHRV